MSVKRRAQRAVQAITVVNPYVRLSVTRCRYCVKITQATVYHLSSLEIVPWFSFFMVNFSANFQREHPERGRRIRGGKEVDHIQGRPRHWQVEAGCFLEKVGGGENQPTGTIRTYEYSVHLYYLASLTVTVWTRLGSLLKCSLDPLAGGEGLVTYSQEPLLAPPLLQI